MFVSLVIPAYKQENTIKKDVESIYNIMSQTRWDFEIIVVVDGLLDSTYENALQINRDNVKVFGYKTNRGKGYAVKYGMSRASGTHIAFIDAGMEIQPNGISMVLEHMEWYGADIIVGSKRHPASKVNYPLLRRLYSWGYYNLVWFLFGLKIRDTQTGLKVYKREVLESVLPRLLIKEYAFDIEILAVAKYQGYTKIYEAPVEINFDFTSGSRFKGFLFFDAFIRKMLLDTLAIFYRLYILRYYDDERRRVWTYDSELEFKINTGGITNAQI